MQLEEIFQQVNQAHFDGFLDPPVLRWNSRLRSAAGRFIPGSRKLWFSMASKDAAPVIEVASYLLQEVGAESLIQDTVAHEMIHYWLWVRKQPYGHTSEFLQKMKSMGVSRYNTVPRLSPFRYVYQCAECRRDFLVRKKLGILACADCCKKHSGGKFHARFQLVLSKKLSADEGLELATQRRSSPQI